jgi:hypothetical protein
MADDAVRIAMWSGPRNISTALLRSWGNRHDTVVVDEPLYAHYLAATGAEHPGRDTVLAEHDADWQRVVATLTGPLPPGATISYQKHMAHHLLPHISREWLGGLTHAFLIRDPREMLASLARVLDAPTLADTGLVQQSEIFDAIATNGHTPPVIDARDVLAQPGPMLQALCEHLGVAFSDRMLHWPAGPRPTDGAWAPWWYDAVIASTRFAPYEPPTTPLPPQLDPLLEQCQPFYDRLYRHRISV